MPDGASDEVYLDAVEQAINGLHAQPVDLVFYLAGADPYRDDALGRLAESRRPRGQTEWYFVHATKKPPVATAMGGGYAPNIDHIVDIHQTTVEIALGLR